MQKVSFLLACAAVSITMMPPVVRANTDNGFVHINRGVTSCVVSHTTSHPRVRDSTTQYNIAYEWTFERGVQAWTMTPWTSVVGYASHARASVLQGAPQPGPAGIQHASISYTTTLQLPSVLASLVNTEQSIHVRKEMYTVGNRIYSFVEIVDVPFLKSIRIDTVMAFYGNRRVISRHNVEYVEFPWMLSWAGSVLKREIIKSLERIDMLSEKKYCND